MNITLGSGKAVHAAEKIDGYAAFPSCGGNKSVGRYSATVREVTCKKCLKMLAQQAEAAERNAYYAGLAETQDAVMAQAEPVTEALAENKQIESKPPQPTETVTGWPVFQVGPCRYAVSPRIQGPFGGVDSVKYFWVDGRYGQADQRNAYPDNATGTVQRRLWQARYDFDMACPKTVRQVSVDMQSPTQGIAIIHGLDGFQGLIGDDGEGRLYASAPYGDKPWHVDGFHSAKYAAEALARHDGFTGDVTVTVLREY